MPPPTPVDEAALRLAYETGAKTRHEICVAFHIGAARLRDYVIKRGWKRKREPERKPKARNLDWVSSKPGVDLAQLQAAYEHGAEPVEVICERFGVGVTWFYRHARPRKWRRDKRAYCRDTLATPLRCYDREEQDALVRSLYAILGAQIAALDADDAGEDDPEVVARQLAQLTRCVRTLEDLRSALDGGAHENAIEDERSTEEICAAIMRRLDERLAAAATPAPSDP